MLVMFRHFPLVQDMFGHNFGALVENDFEKVEILKSNEFLPYHFSIRNKLLRRSGGISGDFCFYMLFRKVLFNDVRQPNVLFHCFQGQIFL